MINTDSQATFSVDIRKADGSTLQVKCRCLTLREYRKTFQSIKELDSVTDDAVWIDGLLDAITGQVVSHTKDELLDSLTLTDLLQLRSDYLHSATLGELDLKKSVWQSKLPTASTSS